MGVVSNKKKALEVKGRKEESPKTILEEMEGKLYKETANIILTHSSCVDVSHMTCTIVLGFGTLVNRDLSLALELPYT